LTGRDFFPTFVALNDKDMATKVNNLDHLRELIQQGKHHFFIGLTSILRSSKYIELAGDQFVVFNEIDGSEDTFTDEEMMDERYTNIGKAISLGRFYCD
jgi:hypothetical protein